MITQKRGEDIIYDVDVYKKENGRIPIKEFLEGLRLESGNYNPSLDFLIKVAQGLGKELKVSLM